MLALVFGSSAVFFFLIGLVFWLTAPRAPSALASRYRAAGVVAVAVAALEGVIVALMILGVGPG